MKKIKTNQDKIFKRLKSNPTRYLDKIDYIKELFNQDLHAYKSYTYPIEENERLSNETEFSIHYYENPNEGISFEYAHKQAIQIGEQIAESYNVELLDATTHIKEIMSEIKESRGEIEKLKEEIKNHSTKIEENNKKLAKFQLIDEEIPEKDYLF